MFFNDVFENVCYISCPQKNQIIIDFPKSTINLTLMNIATNLPEQPTNDESKFKETLKENLQFLKSLAYLTKKIFML